MKKLALLCALLCAGAASAYAQKINPLSRDPSGQNTTEQGRIPKGGVAPMLDIRLQDSGVMLPPEHKPDEAAKSEPKPAATPATPSEQPTPPAPPK